MLVEGPSRVPIRIRLAGVHELEALGRVLVKTSSGALVPRSSVTTLRQGAAPPEVVRVGGERAVEIWVQGAAGVKLDALMAVARPRVEEGVELPAGARLVWHPPR